MEWISVEETPSSFQEETKVLILLKETENFWFPESYADRIEKAWWLPQREAFVFEDVEDAKSLITHWMPLPAPPKEHSHD